VKKDLYYTASVPFEAARQVKILPSGHRSSRIHGHSFLAKVRAVLPENWASFPGAEADDLKAEVQRSVSVLDYDLLNNHIEIPTNENIARWIRSQIEMPNLDVIGIQSTSDQGVDIDQHDHAHIWHRFRFEAAHQLPNVPEGHQCGRMHGHGFEVILHANQDLSKDEMGVDFDQLAAMWLPFHEELNFACMNEIPGLENPTSEMLASWLWERIKPVLPELSWITVYETVTAGCHYDGNHFRIWKEFKFESALKLNNAPNGDRRSGIHGHSYIMRLHLSAPLDKVLGWTVDYGDVKEMFKPIYKQLDHHMLNELPGLNDGDVGSLLYWINEKFAHQLPELDRIDLFETPGCGAFLSWGERSPALPN
jgi:6-pyruvoyltetrahydropterin/6-carboxytetrahydropterin synthase